MAKSKSKPTQFGSLEQLVKDNFDGLQCLLEGLQRQAELAAGALRQPPHHDKEVFQILLLKKGNNVIPIVLHNGTEVTRWAETETIINSIQLFATLKDLP